MTVTIQKKPVIKPDWWIKTLSGAVPGFTLAFALAGLFAWLGPGGIAAPHKVQFVMWMIAPLWLIIFTGVYFFRSGLQAFAWLAVANFFAYLVLFTLNGALRL